MREIKFRAWDSKNNQWLKSFLLGDDGRPMNTVMHNDEMGVAGEHLEDYQNVIVMQYTGLKDKNGNEIYHSDFLEDKQRNLWLVYWADGIAGFRLEQIGDNGVRELDFCEPDDTESMKIIGNTYQNPELLEQETL